MSSVLTLIKKISQRLNETSDTKAWWLIQALTNQNKTKLLNKTEFKLDLDQQALLESWIEQHVKEHKPLQYILGNVPFLDINILVEPPILIPRPETEFWCYNLIQQLQILNNKKIKILDIGTGSGCIALSIAKRFDLAEIYAIDISDKALELAQKNINYNQINNVKLIKSDLFENLQDQTFDLIVSNPPYIDETLFDGLDYSVKNWEDPGALICKDNGLYLIKKIINKVPTFLKYNAEFKQKEIPQLIIEIDSSQAQAVSKYLKENNFFNIKLEKDCFEQDRVISAER